MRVVVTGGLGFVGQNLAHHLRAHFHGLELVAVDWGLHGPDEAVPYDRVIRDDFVSVPALSACTGADAVVHLAAQSGVPQSLADPLATFDQNTWRGQLLLEHLRRASPETRLVFASSSAAGGEGGPRSPYGASKLATEGLMAAYRASYGMRCAALRFANVYGPRSMRQGGLIPAFCRGQLRRAPLRVNGDGRQTRDYVHVEDIAAGIAAAIRREASGTFQLGTGVGTSVMEIVDIFRGLEAGHAPVIEHGPPLSGELRHDRADISHARAVLGFAPSCTLAEGIARTYEWYLSRHDARDRCNAAQLLGVAG